MLRSQPWLRRKAAERSAAFAFPAGAKGRSGLIRQRRIHPPPLSVDSACASIGFTHIVGQVPLQMRPRSRDLGEYVEVPRGRAMESLQ